MPYGEGNPQTEDGYAAIANEILEALAHTELTGGESRCIFYLWRKTYGWSGKNGKPKKSDAIAYGQWASGTGLGRRHVLRTLDGLVNKRIFTKEVVPIPGRNAVTIWGFQKKYHEWNGYHEAEVVSFQPPLGLKVVSPAPPDTDQVVTTTPLDRYKVVARISKVVTTAPLEVVTTAPPTITNITNTITNTAAAVLGVLQSLPSWKYDEKADLEWLQDLMVDYPSFSSLFVKECRDYWSDRKEKTKDKGQWKLRLRNWMRTANKPKKTFGKRPPPGKVSTAEELDDWGHKNDE